MNKIIKFTIIIILFCQDFTTCGQNKESNPYCFIMEEYNDKKSNSFQFTTIPIIEMQAISKLTIDSIKNSNNNGNRAFQFAYSFKTNIDIKEESKIDSLEHGILYLIGIKSPEAKSLNLIFSKFNIPMGAQLYIFNKEKNGLLGAFTNLDTKSHEKLAVRPLLGDMLFIEYFEPYSKNSNGSIILGKVNHDFIGIHGIHSRDEDFGNSGDCEVDINCAEGNNWQTEKRAVCKIIVDGTALCSGTLVNNTNNDGRPFLLTAHHCICDQATAENSTYIFNYESPTCGGVDGSVAQDIDGADLIATFGDTDFTLLELSEALPQNYNIYFAGWDRNVGQSANGVGIHHPMGDVKKISTYTDATVDAECVVNHPVGDVCDLDLTRPNNDYYKVIFAETAPGHHGVTEGGSSGSPLFNNNHRIIGQLFGFDCAGPMCDDPGSDESCYGKLSSSWNGGGTDATRLRNWLDPSNTTTELPGLRLIRNTTVNSNTPASGDIVRFDNVNVQNGANVNVDFEVRFRTSGTFNVPAGSTIRIRSN
jgi:lysyl endopeptidase